MLLDNRPYLKHLNQTFCLSPFAFASIGGAFGSKLNFSNRAPNVCKPAIQSAKEWETLAFPDIETHPQIRFLIESVERMAQNHKDQVPIAGVLPLPSDPSNSGNGIGGLVGNSSF